MLELTEAPPGYAYRIWTVDPSGVRGARPLTQGPQDYWTPYSPAGDRIVFAARGTADELDISTMAADGTDRRQLTHEPTLDTQPAWPPDGHTIAFVSYRGGGGELWAMDVDGGEARRIVALEGEAQNPAWFPDGTRIAFYETDGDGRDGVRVVNVDGSGLRALGSGVWPSWTPDGRHVLFASDGALYSTPADGGPRERLRDGASWPARCRPTVVGSP